MHGRVISLDRTSLIFAFLAAGALSWAQPLSADSFDWRYVDGFNWNTPVKGQFGGTCWDFSSCATHEAKYKLTRNDPLYSPDISEQHVCWETNPDMGSTGGGWGTAVFDYFGSHGVVSEAECPYQPANPDIGVTPYWPLNSGWENRVWKSTAHRNGFTNNTDTMKSYLKTTGPLLVGIWAGHDLYGTVADLKANYRAPDASGYDHQVSLVGYCDDAEVPTGGYWIIKNSWGGDDVSGYHYIPYGNIEIHNDVSAITGAVYYTGSMATVTWKGGSGVWSSGGDNWSGVDQYGASLPAYAWENKETSATFNASTGTALTLSGTVIAHGLTFSSGATGYVFSGVSGGALTVTGGGITAHESVTINAPVTIGAPQTWTVDSGESLVIGGDVHTIISALTITGNGDTTVAGSINGGGVLNANGAAPGAITKYGTGTLHLTGPGTYSVPVTASGTVSFEQAGNTSAFFTGKLSGGCVVTKSNSGTIALSGSNNYTGTTIVSNGALQADSGVGLPYGSFLNLAGGVIQSNGTGTVTFSRTLASSGSGKFRFSGTGGGFAAGASPMIVKINNGTSTISWGTASTNIAGILKFGSLTAGNVVTLQNGINLAGATRVIQVDDNLTSTADRAVISGVITYGSGTAGITKTGDGLLVLSGVNTYNGATTISGGALQVDEGVGLPAGGMLVLDGGVLQNNSAVTFNHSLSAFQWTENGGGFSAGNGPMTVNIGGSAATLNWGAGVGNGIMGTLKLGSPTSTNALTFQNGIDLNGGGRTIEVGGSTATLTGVVSDSVDGGYLTKTGPGTLVLPVANTFSGNLVVSGGTLVGTVFNAFGPMTAARSIVANSGGTLSLGVSDMLGAYASTTIPTVDIEGGVVTNANGAHQAFNSLILNNGTLLAASNAGTPGGGGWGTWNLNGTVTSHGASAISATDPNATVTLLSGDYANPSTTFNVADGVLSVSVPIYNGIDGHTTGGSYNLHTTALVKTGAGTLILSAVNRYSGVTTVNGGVLSTNNLAASGVNSGIGSGASLVLDGGGMLQYTGPANSAFNRPIALGVNGGGIDQSGSGALSYSGVISGTGAFTSQGAGTLILTGAANTYSGITTVAGGKLVLAKTSGYAIPGDLTIANANTAVVVQNVNQFPTTAVVTFTGTGNAALEVYGHSVTVGGIAGDGVIENTETETGLGRGALIVNNSADYTFSGYLRNSHGGSGALSLTKNGGGVLTLTGANTGMFTGGLTVNAGTLDYSGGVMPVCNYTITGGRLNVGTISQPIGTLQITGGTISGPGAVVSNYSYNVQAGTIDAVLTGIVGLNKTGAGSATVNSPTYTGTTFVQAGRLTFTGGLPTGNLYVAGGTLDIGSLSRSIRTLQVNGGTITGSGALTITTGVFNIQGGQVDVGLDGASNVMTKTSTQTAILGGANTYGGQTNVNAGTLQVQNLSALGTVAGKTVVANGAVLSAAGGLAGSINESIDLNGYGDSNGALQAVGAGTDVAFSGPVSLVSNAGIGGTSHLAVSGNIAGSGGLTKCGSNRVDLSGANTYSGLTTVMQGTLALGPAAQNAVLNLGGADVQGGKMIFGYSGATSPAATIAALLSGSFDGGLWDVGQLKSSTAIAAGLTLGWFDDGATAVTVMPTYAGDFDLDGTVDAADLNVWVANVGAGSTWQAGDANYDGVVNLIDLDFWKANFGRSAPAGGFSFSAPSAVGVPEPGTLALLAVGLIGLLACAWRKKQ